jgi:cobaltochelatase CobN
MHLLRTDTRSLDEAEQAIDLAQSPAEMVFLSFADSDLAVMAAAAESTPDRAPSLRIASLKQLRHPFSIDLYLDKVVRRARFVLVRLLGGLEYWRYGVDELARAAREHGFVLAIVPGDAVADDRLAEASTLPAEELGRIWRYFEEGGAANLRECLAFARDRSGTATAWAEPKPVPRMGLFREACRPATAGAARATIVFYRSALLAADTAPISTLASALAARGVAVDAVFVSSLKDPLAAEPLAEHIAATQPDVILNTTAFSARADDGPGVLDRADCPVFQVMLAGSPREAWAESGRGLGAADLAMNVVLPELDGRIVTRAISFKAEMDRNEAFEFTRIAHRPDPGRCDAVAELAAAWAHLRQLPAKNRRIACVLPDYPGKGGRSGYAVGLDTPASVLAIAEDLKRAGYTVADLPARDALIDALRAEGATMTLILYRRLYGALPEGFRASVEAQWGRPEADPAVVADAFRLSFLQSGSLIVALQPDRGRPEDRKGEYHDPTRPPRHAYIAFYLWLRHVAAADAILHCGTHGTLEWLPGKATALSEDCAPEAVLGPVPVIYPFIVNNPGEAAQAKRRIAAVTIGHLTPPLVEAGTHGATAELEGLFDEYAEAQLLDPRRARTLADAILAMAGETGLAQESGVDPSADPEDRLAQLEAWLCDIKEMRIGDGLHTFARGDDPACAEGERKGFLTALAGRFVEPGPAGAPSRGRLDVLPTGRNLYTIDPRAVPTRTAWEVGRRTAEEVLTRYAQDHGDWPKTIVLNLWGSASMRTGGDDLAQAMALIGVKPVWDDASTRVSGFEILPLALLGRPRVDVTLRISGLFRDVFPAQIALFDEAVRAVATLNEVPGENPLADTVRNLPEAERRAATWRIFGASPGAYGTGVAARALAAAWADRAELGAAYLSATSHAYGAGPEGIDAAGRFRDRVASAEAYVHVQDMAGQDVLDSDAFAEHEGGFAAAAETAGATPALLHVDATRPEAVKVRPLADEIARVLRARATNPRWIAGQMRHGYRGAAEIAETVDNLFVFAATTDAVESRHFDLLFAAILEDDRVREFLRAANPEAARAIAARFDEAMRRGFWTTRRNSSAMRLAELLEAAA